MAKFIDLMSLIEIHTDYQETIGNSKNNPVPIKRAGDEYARKIRECKILPPAKIDDNASNIAYTIAYNMVGEAPNTQNANRYLEAFELISKFIDSLNIVEK